MLKIRANEIQEGLAQVGILMKTVSDGTGDPPWSPRRKHRSAREKQGR